MSQGPPALLPVSFALAKDWLPKQQKAQSEALETGAVNEEAREVVANSNRSLAEQPASTAALLEWPARPASPVVPPPGMSLGLEPVTDQVIAKDQAEERERRQAQAAAQPDNKLHRKKASIEEEEGGPSRVRERQKRASACMLELGVAPLQVMIQFLLQ